MQYPRMPEDADRRKKLTVRDVATIRELFKEGWGMRQIARKYGVTHFTIRYWLDDEFKDSDNKKKTATTMHKLKTDPSFVEHRKQIAADVFQHRLKHNPKWKQYHTAMAYKWRTGRPHPLTQ